MKTNIRHLLLLLFAINLFIPTARSQEGNSPFNPAPVGVKLSGIIECGQGYTSHELYNMKITLLEVIRGDNAWKRLQTTSSTNKPAGSRFEYILARVRFEYYARGKPGLCVHNLTPEQFTACSVEGVDYPEADVILPQPEMQGDLRSGESIEGWIALLVPITDRKPLLYYSADAGAAVQHGGGKWFKLY